MKIVILNSNENYNIILEYLHFHLDKTFIRELLNVNSDKFIPRYIINEPTFEYIGINFSILTNDIYKINQNNFYKYSELILEHESIEHISKFINDSVEYIIKNKHYLDKLYVYKSCYRTWTLETELLKRDINNIYILPKIKNDLLLDITSFNEPSVIEKYKQLCINHVRLYMFYGPPGTGKTSLTKSIGTYFNKNIAYLTIKLEQTADDLKTCIQNIPSNSILCIEDIDSLFVEDRKNETALSFSGFINCFDGLSTPENLIVIMTTNNLNHLDHAIIRRISYFIEFKFAVKEQIKQMFEAFFPDYSNDFDKFYANIGEIQVTINILEKFFIKYLFSDIIKESKNFSKFANGELKVEIIHSNKLYL